MRDLFNALQVADKLKAENRQLRAELELLRPKPVVAIGYMSVVDGEGSYVTPKRQSGDNLKLTFTDGKLTKAEVIG